MPPERNGSPDLREQPVGELLKQLSQETGTLVRQELALARAELAEKGQAAKTGGGLFAGAGLVGLLAAGALTTCLIAALATGMDVWLAALIVAVVYAAVAGALATIGRDRLAQATPAVPQQTQHSVKEDVEWAKTRARSART
jgi:predicted lipid-binding transport protein (Tim44 family)